MSTNCIACDGPIASDDWVITATGPLHNTCASNEIDLLRAKVAKLENSPTMKWEADHQRAALEALGLADEFPWGCDAIEKVAEALIASRARVAELEGKLPETEDGERITLGMMLYTIDYANRRVVRWGNVVAMTDSEVMAKGGDMWLSARYSFSTREAAEATMKEAT